MRISEAAHQSELTVDTIRFYERSGLMPPIARQADGTRRFSPKDVEWLTLLASLRRTGMTLADMRHFAALYRAGDQTVPERRQVLQQHAEALTQRRKELDACATLLAKKLEMYDRIERA